MGLDCMIKGTLMQIWKSCYMSVFVSKQFSENFAFFILKIIEYLPVKFVYFLKSRLIFNLFCRKQIFHISHVRTSPNGKGGSVWNLQHIIFIWRQRYWHIFKSALRPHTPVVICFNQSHTKVTSFEPFQSQFNSK